MVGLAWHVPGFPTCPQCCCATPVYFAALTLSSLVQAEGLQLAPVEVTTAEASAAEIAQAQLKSVPGGTNYIDMDSVQQGRVSSNEDVFKYQAGVRQGGQ